MKAGNEFVTYLLELLAPFGPVKAKAMFGGFGIYRNELMFGIVEDNRLYLKVDEHTREDFEAKGLKPFTYVRKGKEVSLSYCQAPDEALDDSETLCEWAKKAYDAAVRGVMGSQKTTGKR